MAILNTSQCSAVIHWIRNVPTQHAVIQWNLLQERRKDTHRLTLLRDRDATLPGYHGRLNSSDTTLHEAHKAIEQI